MDPYNGQISDWIKQLSRGKSNSASAHSNAALGTLDQKVRLAG
jgi:hypothetical protein